jgi:MoCo/4Fe-4S cofactor protein with predicted Tat translocation signal
MTDKRRRLMSNRLAQPVSLPLFPLEPVFDRVAEATRAPDAAREGSGASDGFDALRRRAAGEHGRRYWRSINDLAESPELAEYVHREFPQQAGEWHDPVSRRNFVKLMGASLALAGVGLNVGCEQKEEKIVPYVNPPENLIPGKPLFYATAMPFRGGQAIGVLVEQHMGRPTKIEGNPEHPASLGATDAITQASILSLYDPDRSQTPREAENLTTWGTFFARMERVLYPDGKPNANLRLRILTESVCSPTLGDQIRKLLAQFPQGKWHQYEPVNRDNVNTAARSAFGQATNTYYDFSKAARVVSLDCNFLHDEPGSIRYARQFIDGRRMRVEGKGANKSLRRETASKVASEMTPAEGEASMNRLYVVESTPTITGAMADHRVALKPSQVYDFALALAQAVGAQTGGHRAGALPEAATRLVEAIALDLREHTGRSVVLAGENQPPAVHVLAHAINTALQNVGEGKAVLHTDPVEVPTGSDQTQVQSLQTLVTDMGAGNVDVLLMLGGNPVYNAPADLNFTAALDAFAAAKAGDGARGFKNVVVHLSPHFDETSFRCHWHLPESHYLEAWGDLRAFDGTVSVQQPLIAPLYGTKSILEVVSGLLRNPDATGYDLVRNYWQAQGIGGSGGAAGADFEQAWRKTLHDGIVPNTALPVRAAALQGDLAAAIARPALPAGEQGDYEICFRPDPNVWDGRWANNGWLQELPKPLTKITWDNVILMSPKTYADRLKLAPRDADSRHCPTVTVSRGGRSVTGPVWVSYGHPDDSITVHLGFGRSRAGRVGGLDADTSPGFDAYAIRTADAQHLAADVRIDPTGDTYEIACTQHHQLIELPADAGGPMAGENLNKTRDLVRVLDLAELTHHDAGAHAPQHLSLYPEYDYDNSGLHKWGMVIDQNACIGCNACVTACQSENNIAIVGKEQVIMQRELHWLRIDTYYTGDPVTPDMMFQPMLCQHCEKAPCEVVCPVAATTHSAEGINEMTYNRCVGTRYCSNNCPYKVRRFNFLQYNDNREQSLKLMRNPDVTVRNRGVMEKCTYCVQRVNLTRIELKKLEVELTTSQAAGPASATPTEQQRTRDQYQETLANLQTACQQSCPTEAIVFGDLNARAKFTSVGVPEAEARSLPVARLKSRSSPDVHYALLTDLNTQPRTTYLARFRNPNPALGAPATDAPKGPGHG